MKNYLFAAGAALVAASLSFGVLAAWDGWSGGDDGLPVQERAKGFELTNQNGDTVSLQGSGGKVRLVSFFYVRCPHPSMCPSGTKKLVELQESLGKRNEEVVFLRVSFDPENDRPETLKKYGRAYGVDFANWHFLTGEADAIEAACETYDIDLVEKKEGLYKHSMLLYLIDQQGHVRKVYAGMMWKPETVEKDVRTLLDET